MYIDSHCHYDLAVFNGNRFELLAEFKKVGVEKLIIPAILAESNINMRDKLDYSCNPLLLAECGCAQEQLPKVFFSAGIHPTRTWKNPGVSVASKQKFILNALKRPHTVAIGETGLDYHRELFKTAFRNTQIFWFEYQLSLAKENKLPIILHIRDAFDDAISILKSADLSYGGVAHCFCEGYETAKRYIDIGLMIGVGGLIFENGELIDAVSKIPLESILLETDAPSVKPIWDGNRYNTSLNIPRIADRIAEIKNIGVETVIEQTTKNAVRLFGI